MRCPWCRGSGLNKAEYGPVPCADCRGVGWVECYRCGESQCEQYDVADEKRWLCERCREIADRRKGGEL